MAQADHVSNAAGALITGAGAKPSASPVRVAHADLFTAIAGRPPWQIPLFVDASDLEDRADHLNKAINAVSVCVTAILDDTAQNLPGGLDLGQIDALLSELESDVTGALRRAAEGIARRGA
jgi:hypothetical protein